MKWSGVIGFGITEETTAGVWVENVKERIYYGDVIRSSKRTQPASDRLNDNIVISNQISIVADPFAYENYLHMLYIEFMGTKWKIDNIEVQYPRLLLNMGGVYNE